MRELRLLHVQRNASPPEPPRLDHPQKKRIAREKVIAQPLAIAVPQDFLSPPASKGSAKHAHEDNAHRIVEKNDRVRPTPGNLAHLAEVVPAGDPPATC